MADDRGWEWDEKRGEIRDGDGCIVAVVVSDSAADPRDGDGPIMAAARDLLEALEMALSANGRTVGQAWDDVALEPWEVRAREAIEKARKP